MKNKDQIVIYKSSTGEIKIQVKFDRDTVWLSQAKIAELFQTDRSVITKHIINIFKTKEVDEKSNVQKMHITNSDKPVKVYSLDVIISVGYRINSFKATKFRIWATKTLKQYLIKGYALNQKQLKEQQKNLKILSDSVALIKSKIQSPILAGQESELFEIIKTYIDSLRLLKLYDDQQLPDEKLKSITKFALVYEEVIKNINELKESLVKRNLASDNFGLENRNKLKSAIGAIGQTFDGRELYSSIEEKAANLLYFIIKDHPFVDGNKRIGSTLFIYFLSKNNCLFKQNGEVKINDRALVALALLVAVSDPREKETIVKLIINLIK